MKSNSNICMKLVANVIISISTIFSLFDEDNYYKLLTFSENVMDGL